MTVEEILSAETEILKAAQTVAFSKEMGLLKLFPEGKKIASAAEESHEGNKQKKLNSP